MRFSFIMNILYYSLVRPAMSLLFLGGCLLLLSNSSCSTIRVNPKIHEDFRPYVQKFIDDSGGTVKWKHLKDYNMQYVDNMDRNIIGTCDRRSKEILINRAYWERTDTRELERKALFYHELAHCILERNHTQPHIFPYDWATKFENLMLKIGKWKMVPPLEDGCAGSLMHPSTDSYYCIHKHWDYYVYELFQNDERGKYIKSHTIDRVVNSVKSCAEPEIVNETDIWNEEDEGNKNTAMTRCLEMYGTCLKTFYKREELTYGAICY
jgi:hypothetical protein